MPDTYYVELVQTDPPGSPTPGCGHYAGEISGFPTAIDALAAGIAHLGRTAGERFHPCCDWQREDTLITDCVVYSEDEDGNRDEANPIQAHLRRNDPMSEEEKRAEDWSE